MRIRSTRRAPKEEPTEPSGKTVDALVASVKIDDADVARRKRFLDLTERDVERLFALHKQIGANGEKVVFLDAFYQHLLAFDETARFLKDEAMVARLKVLQARHFDSLTAGSYGPDYFGDRIRVGAAHWRIRLEPQWYLGAYCKYLILLLSSLRKSLSSDPTAFLETLSALFKIIFLDLGLAFETYIRCERNAIQEKASQLAALNKVVGAITTSLDVVETLDQIMHSARTLTRSKACCIAFFDHHTNLFTNWVTQGLSEHFVENMSFRSGGLADEVFTTTRSNGALAGAYIVSNDQPQTRHKLSKLTHDEGILGFACLPLESQARRLGVIYVYRSDRDTFEPSDIELLQTFALLAAQAIDNARMHKVTMDQAIVDPLTGLYNRREFELRLGAEYARAARYNRALSILFLDIDHFKQVNDTHGHAAGDVVLKVLADILRRQLRANDVPARYGGEEFVVILPEITGEAAKEIAERLRRAVAATSFRLPQGHEITLTISIGVSCYPACGGTAPQIVDYADQALYAAKNSGRNRVVLYSERPKAES